MPYVALVCFNRRNAVAATSSAACGFTVCLGWYLFAYASTALFGPLLGPTAAGIPPFFVGLSASALVWALFARSSVFIEKASA